MANKPRSIYSAFYRRLLTFYPKPFRQRFGESMEQTFSDLCNEQEDHRERMLSLTIRISFDTGVGIIKEHLLHLSKRGTMASILINPKTAAVIGVLLFLPGAIVVALLMLGIEPPLGPLKPYLEPAEGPHLLGSLVVLCLLLLLPAAAVAINVAATEGRVLRNISADLVRGAMIGLLAVLPFVILESTLGQTSYSTFPTGLFGILWIVPTIFAVVLTPIVRNLRTGKDIMVNPATLLFRAAFLIVLAVFWSGLVIDQMPCFLGVPNCD